MKRPVLLIVDDDEAALQSLEFALQGRFSDLFNIEAFSAPKDALRAVAAWDIESRCVAVAVVDEKMPGMRGSECIAQLRNFSICAHTQSIILTGYAELDLAITAKNRSSVGRFLEKPCLPSFLADQVKLLLRRWVHSSDQDSFLEFKEAIHRTDILEHLKIRHNVYRQTEVTETFISSTAPGLDLDSFDQNSYLFNLILTASEKKVVIGTLRLTGQTPTQARDILRDLPDSESSSPEKSLPMLTYHHDHTAINQLLAVFDQEGESYVEAGRLTLAPSSRGGAVQCHGNAHSRTRLPGRLAHHLINMSAAWAFIILGKAHVLIACLPSHARLYRYLGFKEATGTSRGYNHAVGAEVVCLHGSANGLSDRVMVHLRHVAQRVQNGRPACVCANFPQCLGEPYETGDFSAVDIFCPASAAEKWA